MPTNLTRRELLETGGVAALAAAAGCYTTQSDDSVLVAGGGAATGTTALLDGYIVVASDYAAAADAVGDRQPTLALTSRDWFVFNNTREGVRMSDLQLEFGVDSYAAAEELLDTRPALMFTSDGIPFTFTDDEGGA